jgi:PAS domain S-box-containing protein
MNREESIFTISGEICEPSIKRDIATHTENIIDTTINAFEEWVIIVDNKFDIVFANKSLLPILRLLNLPSNIIGNNIRELNDLLPDSICVDQEIVFDTAKEIIIDYTRIYNGKTFNFEAKIKPVLSGEEVILAITIVKDITEQNRLETELRRNQKYFSEIIYSIGDFVWEMDINGVFTYMNAKSEDIIGYHPDEIIGKSYIDVISSSSEKSKNNIINAVTQKEPILGSELYLPSKNNQKVCLLIYGVPFYDDENKFQGYRGVTKDITESKMEHEQIVWNANILKVLSENYLLGLYFIGDSNNEILFFNKKFCELWGIEDCEKQIQQGSISHEDVLNILSTKVKNPTQFRRSINISNRDFQKLKFENEYLLLNNRVIYNYSTHIKNDDGIDIGRLYIFKDISEQNIIASLKKDEEEYNNLIEQAPDAIIISDMEANILSVNPITISLLGYSETELLKMKVEQIIDPANLLLTPLRIDEIHTGKTLLVKRVFVNSLGDKIKAEVRVKKIPGNKIFAIVRDLSDRDKRMKEQDVPLKSELLKKLYFKLKSFKHGEDSSMILNRISLLTRNINDIWSNHEIISDLKKSGINNRIENLSRAKSLADEYIILSYPQLKHIVSLLEIIETELTDFKILGLSKTNINVLRSASEFLKLCFDKFLESTLVKVEVPERYRNGREIIESVKTIKKSLDRLSKIFEDYFVSNFREEIYIVANKYKRLNHDISISFCDLSNHTHAIVNKDELKEILVILFSNSIEALSISDKTNKIININVKNTESKIIIEFENNGVDIDENVRGKIFTEKATTKGEKRGFGLYYSKKCLQKYGGSIYLDELYDKGTKFVIELIPV